LFQFHPPSLSLSFDVLFLSFRFGFSVFFLACVVPLSSLCCTLSYPPLSFFVVQRGGIGLRRESWGETQTRRRSAEGSARMFLRFPFNFLLLLSTRGNRSELRGILNLLQPARRSRMSRKCRGATRRFPDDLANGEFLLYKASDCY